MHTTIKFSPDMNRAIMLRSFHDRAIKRLKASQPQKRSEALLGSKSYRDALQRAFNNAKEQVFFNPDMQYFLTFTYRGNGHTIEDVMADMKAFLKKERRATGEEPKYIWVAEYQKRGSIHVHMITNNPFLTYRNKNGYLSLTNWPHGFTSVLSINDFDNNFRPHLYLFKYMKKAQRIGKSFLHTSRNLSKKFEHPDATIDLQQWRTLTMEYTHTHIQTTNFHYFKNYLEFDVTMNPQHLNEGT